MNKRKAGKDAAVVAEYRLLNALIHNKQWRSDSRVYEECFIHETAKSLFVAIQQLDEEALEISKASLLQRGNEVDFSVTKQIVDAVYDIDDGAADLTDMITALDTARTKLAISESLASLQKMMAEGGDIDHEAVTKELFDVEGLLKNSGVKSSLVSLEQWSDDYIDELKQRATGTRRLYGDQLLDEELIKGAYPGAITTIAASTGQGKSTYVLNLINSLINMSMPCMYVTLEMSGIDTYDRLVSLRKGIPLHDLYSHDAATIESIIKIVAAEKEELKNNHNFALVDEPSLSLARLRAIIKEYKQRTKNDYVMVVVDLATQLADFTKASSGMNLANSIEVAMNNANSIAKELGIHFFFVVQFNRQADNVRISSLEDIETLRPSLGDIKNSGAIAERSRVVLGAFRRRWYIDNYLQHIPEAAEVADIMEVRILKSSSGPGGKILKYYFDGSLFTVTPMLEDATDLVDIDY